MKYVALLRGINVGGNRKVPMKELRECLEKAGLKNVRTYIQSGNVLFESDESTKKLYDGIEKALVDTFGFKVPIVLLSEQQLEGIVQNVPRGWMKDDEWKYNYLFLRPPYDESDVLEGIGTLKPDIEALTMGDGVIYQSMSRKLFGRTTTGKLASKPVYQLMTIRGHNTVMKLLELMSL